MPNFVICSRMIKNKKFIGEPGEPIFLQSPQGKIFLPEHQVKNPQTWVNRVRKAAEQKTPTGITPSGDVLVFVHGYNNTPESILNRHEWLQSTLSAEGWGGIVISYDWPCEEQTLNYYEDRTDASATAQFLVTHGITLLANGQVNGCDVNVHLLGHSTGAYVIREAFRRAEDKGELFKSTWRVGQVALIGGDISSSALSEKDEKSAPMFKRIMRLTNYQNGFDWVLGVSNAKRLGTAPRVGRHGVPKDAHPKCVNVDCSEYFEGFNPEDQVHKTGTWEHSWHIGNHVFARDLAMALEGRIDRNYITTRKIVDGRLVLRDKSRPSIDTEPRNLESRTC